MAVNVGAGILEEMQKHGDHPLRDSDFQKNADGTEFERNVGMKGVYAASNASGKWEVAYYPSFFEL